MTDSSWRPLLRTHTPTVTKVMRSTAFLHARERAATTIESADELRTLADQVELLDETQPPLSAVADRICASVRLLRSAAERVDQLASTPQGRAHLDGAIPAAAGIAARERLVVAALYYLITPVDLVPDFQAGGYIDDVLLLSWVFGAAAHELAPFLAEDVAAADVGPADGGLEGPLPEGTPT